MPDEIEDIVPALDALQAVLLITKHLDTLLPFLLALRRVPGHLPQRVGLLQSIAHDIAGDPEFAGDWYGALELLTGDDLSARGGSTLPPGRDFVEWSPGRRMGHSIQDWALG
jgi:hypothetical protein